MSDKSNTDRSLILSFFCLLAIAFSQTCFAQTYAVTDLGSLGGTRSVAFKINNVGQVVGCSETADGHHRAFLHIDARMVELGTFGGAESHAYSLNDSGEVVGSTRTPDGRLRAFSYRAGRLEDLGSLGGPASVAWVINKSGQAVGYSTTLCGHQRAVRYSEGKVGDIDQFPGGSEPTGINDAGHIIGYYYPEPHGGTRLIFFDTGDSTKVLGSLSGGDSVATDINNSDQIVGYSQAHDSEPHAFLYHSGVMQDLGTLPGGAQSMAYGINNYGQVVGASDSSSSGLHAFLYSKGVMRDLNELIAPDSGWVLTIARSINDAGQIVGEGWIRGKQHAFLLWPVAPSGKTF